MSVLEDLRTRRAALQTEIDGLLATDLPEERSAADAANTTITERLEQRTALDARITQLDDEESRRQTEGAAQKRLGVPLGADGQPRAHVTRDQLTYSRYSSMENRTSYYKDLTTLATRGLGMEEAQARLNRHAQEMDVELPARARRRDEAAEREARRVFDQRNPFEKRVNPNRTDGQGGYLVPPVWLMDDLIPVLRSGRVLADNVRKMDLPSGTDSINIPKLASGTSTAVQTADAAGVSSTDFTDTSVSAGVKTIAGQEDVGIQLIEQSPLSLDEIIFGDLIADYNKKLDLQVASGSGSSGQMTGLYSSAGASLWTSYNQISYTDASPTVGELFSPLSQAFSQIEQNRFDLENVKVFMHSRRWFWMVAATDTTGRPLVLPAQGFGAFNALALADQPQSPPGYKGQLAHGFPAYTDPNITTADTAGSGSGQDVIFALKTDDAFLFEGEMRQRTLPEVLSGTLQVRFQVYNYCAFLLRYGQSLAIISGTGLAAPSGF